MRILFIYLRKFFLSKRQEWSKFDAVFMYLGIIISVAALVTTFIIFEGYETTLKKTILGVNSHIYIFKSGVNDIDPDSFKRLSEFLDNKPEVDTYSGVITGQAIASSGDRAKGCLYKSVDWAKEQQSSIYSQAVFEGIYELHNQNDVVIGKYLAQMLDVNIGDEIQIMSVSSAHVGVTGIRYRVLKMKIVGLFYSGMYEYDSRYVFLNPETAKYFDNSNAKYNMIEVKLKEDYIEKADELAFYWDRAFANEFQINSWEHFNGNLFSLLALEKWVLSIVLSFLIIVASFNVITTTMASILEKRKEIGLLKTLGLNGRKIAQIFLLQNSLISSICILLGIFTGIGMGYLISYQTMISLRGEVYLLDKIHIYVDFWMMLLIFGVAFVIINISGIIPLRYISKMKEIEILRYKE